MVGCNNWLFLFHFFHMRIYIIVICLLLSVSATAQQKTQVQYSMTKEELMAKRKELQDDIAETERRLQMIKSDKQSTMSQLRDLQNKLALRQRLIANINDEMNDIDNTIRNSSKEVVNLKTKLENLKISYAQSIRYAYQTRSSYDMIAFLFSSRDFNDVLRRMKYLKKFRDFRKQQVDQIISTQTQLQRKIGVLTNVKQQKDKLLDTEEEQKKVLLQETDHTNQVIQELKGRESELLSNIEKNRMVAKRVNKAINDIIEREIAKAAKEAEEAEKKRIEEEKNKAVANTIAKPPVPKTEAPPTAPSPSPPVVTPRPKPVRTESVPLLLTPTSVALAANFEGNKGKLYWPVDKGYITDHFGTHPHPVERQVMIENYGVDILTDENAPIKAVFEGKVSSIFSTAGTQQIVMITHGNYFTVYNGLSSVSVKIGDQVTAKQVLGRVGTNDEGQPTINFQIWVSKGKKSNTKLNPELWLGKAR